MLSEHKDTILVAKHFKKCLELVDFLLFVATAVHAADKNKDRLCTTSILTV